MKALSVLIALTLVLWMSYRKKPVPFILELNVRLAQESEKLKEKVEWL